MFKVKKTRYLEGKNNFIIFLALLTAFLILGVGIFLNTTTKAQKTAVLELFIAPTPTPIPLPTPVPIPKTAITSQTSPDGTAMLILKTKEKNAKAGEFAGKTDYSLFVTSQEVLTEKKIFSEIINNKTNLALPFNTWSPDKKHFFVERKIGLLTEYLVFNASGEEFVEGVAGDPPVPVTKPFLNVNSYYLATEIPFELNEVTGWAAPYLLIITTTEKNADGTKTEGPSYWFDVSRQSFIRLSTKF